MSKNISSNNKRKNTAADAAIDLSKSGDDSRHTYTKAEVSGFVDYINQRLAHDETLAHILPIDPDSMDILAAVKSGVLLNKLLFSLFPDVAKIDKVLTNKNINMFELIQNNNICLDNCKRCGVKVVGIGAEDLRDGSVVLIFGLIWQIIKSGLLSKVNVDAHPELLELQEEGEEISELSKMHPEKLLLRWVNWHLANAKSDRKMTNFTTDIQDSVIYGTLLNQLNSEECPLDVLEKSDLKERAEAVLVNADKLGCRKFVKAEDVVDGNYKLNMAFVANLFTDRGKFADTQESAATVRARLEKEEALKKAEAEKKRLMEEAEQRARAMEEAAREAAQRADEERARTKEAERARKEAEERERVAAQAREKERKEAEARLKALEAEAAAKNAESSEVMRSMRAEYEQLREARERDLKQFEEERAANANELEEALARAARAEEATAQEARAKAEAATRLEQERREFEEELARMREELDAAKKEHDEDVERMKESARVWYEKQKAEIGEHRAKFGEERDALVAKCNDKEALLRKYKDALQKAREQRDATKRKLTVTSGEVSDAVAQLREQLEEKNADIERLQRELDAAANTSVDDAALAQLREEHEQAIALLKRQAMEALQTVQRDAENRVAVVRSQLGVRIQELEAAVRARDAELAASTAAKGSDSAESKELKKALKAAKAEAKRANMTLAELRARIKELKPLKHQRRGELVKYGHSIKTWNRRTFAQLRNVLAYFRDDGSCGGVLDMSEASVTTPAALGLATGTSRMTLGVNKPTAFEFVVQAGSESMRLCAKDDQDERLWKESITAHAHAWKALESLLDELC